MGSRRIRQRPMEVPNEDQMPRPLIAWGILAATVTGLRDNFQDAMPRLDIDSLKIDITDPLRVVSYPAILVRLSSITIENSGFHSGSPYPMDYETNSLRHFVLKSKGQVTLEIWSEAAMELVSIQDHITQLYLMDYLYEDTFYFPGTNKEYIGMNFQPGTISWNQFSAQDHHDQQDVPDRLYNTSCSFEFRADHQVPYELDRISAINVEALPTMEPRNENLPPLSASLP